jgi:hypothetical protein
MSGFAAWWPMILAVGLLLFIVFFSAVLKLGSGAKDSPFLVLMTSEERQHVRWSVMGLRVGIALTAFGAVLWADKAAPGFVVTIIGIVGVLLLMNANVFSSYIRLHSVVDGDTTCTGRDLVALVERYYADHKAQTTQPISAKVLEGNRIRLTVDNKEYFLTTPKGAAKKVVAALKVAYPDDVEEIVLNANYGTVIATVNP